MAAVSLGKLIIGGARYSSVFYFFSYIPLPLLGAPLALTAQPRGICCGILDGGLCNSIVWSKKVRNVEQA